MIIDPTVLIVDDNEMFRETLRGLFGIRYPTLRVLEAGNGAEAVELATHHLPHVVFLDLSMPIMNGHDAALLLRANPKTAAIPLVLMTSEDPSDRLVQQLLPLCQGYLAKPFSFKELEHLLIGLAPVQAGPARRHRAPVQRQYMSAAPSL